MTSIRSVTQTENSQEKEEDPGHKKKGIRSTYDPRTRLIVERTSVW